MKVIKQFHGSGVCVIKSEIYDVKKDGDTLYLTHGLDLTIGINTNSPVLLYDEKKHELKEGGKLLKIISNSPNIYNWASTSICDTINLSALIKIDIQANEIYKADIIEKLSVKKAIHNRPLE